MININYEGKWIDLQTATAKANELLHNKNFLALIEEKESFDNTSISGRKIVELIQSTNTEMYVLTYKSIKRWVYGYEDSRYPDLIHINLWRNEWNIPSLVNTIIHECIHCIDSLNNQYSFTHIGNSSVGQENTAPYWIGNLAEEFLAGNKPLAIIEFDKHPEDDFFA